MICKNCGNNVEEGVKFCPNCGQPIENNNGMEQQNTVIESDVNAEPTHVVEQNTSVEQQDINVNTGAQTSIEEPIISTNVESVNQPVNNIPIDNLDQGSNSDVQMDNVTVNESIPPKKSGSKVGLIIGISVGSLFLLICIIICALLFLKSILTKGNQINVNIKEKNVATTTAKGENINESGNVGSNWKDYKVSINRKTITLPCSYNDLTAATGAKMRETQEQNGLDKNYYSLGNLYKNDKFALNIELLNDTSGTIKQKDAKVTRITQTKYNKTSVDINIIFPGNFKPGMPVDEGTIKNVLGEPTNVRNYDAENYKSITYMYNADSTYTTINYYKIEVVNGVINELTLDHRNY